jgi:hypothetical protein
MEAGFVPSSRFVFFNLRFRGGRSLSAGTPIHKAAVERL